MDSTKKNSILIRLSDQELKALDDGWFDYVYVTGERISRLEYIRTCVGFVNNQMREIALGKRQIKNEDNSN